MAFRQIPDGFCLDRYNCGDIRWATTVSPGNTTGKTGLSNEIASIEQLQEFGFLAWNPTGASVSGLLFPVVGEAGPNFTEVATQSLKSQCEIAHGMTHYVMVGEVKIMDDVGPTVQTVFILLNGFIIAQWTSSGGLGYTQEFELFGTIPNLVIPQGFTTTIECELRSTKTSPRGYVASTTGYLDGFTKFNLKFARSC